VRQLPRLFAKPRWQRLRLKFGRESYSFNCQYLYLPPWASRTLLYALPAPAVSVHFCLRQQPLTLFAPPWAGFMDARYDRLMRWRTETACRRMITAFNVLPTQALVLIARSR